MGFCDQVNKELEGPQISVRLLAYKIQSPQEWEAVQALTVLEACMKNCGQRFHNEVGKFKFLNELIKVVSPKYLGDKISEKVKRKVIELLYCWTVSLPDETKISEAYQMLKTQGIVSVDPEISLDVTLLPSPSARPKNPVFDDERKSKKLAELLKSKKPEDLQEANRLIKSMVKEDEARAQKATKQKSTLEAASNSVKLLNEMLTHFSPEGSTDGDKELIRELYGDCDKLRQTISQLASETEDNDSSLGDILQASDDLSHVINSYKKIIEGAKINGETEEAQQRSSSGNKDSGPSSQSEILIDLVGVDSQTPSPPEQPLPASAPSFSDELLCGAAATDAQSQRAAAAPSAALSLLDEELLCFGLGDPAPVLSDSTLKNQSDHLSSLQGSNHGLDLFGPTLPAVPALSSSSSFLDTLCTTGTSVNPTKTSTAALNLSGLVFPAPSASVTLPQSVSSVMASNVAPAARSLKTTLSPPSVTPAASQQVFPSSGLFPPSSASLSQNLQDLTLLDLASMNKPGAASTTAASLTAAETPAWSAAPLTKSQAEDSPVLRSLSPILPLSQASAAKEQDLSLANVFVPLDAIKPSKVCPVTAYDKNGVRVLLHFATDCPPGRPDVLVMVASMLNTSPQAVRNVLLQVAVPKMMKVRLQPPSGTELAPFNPVLPPAAITQVMLLANPLKEKVRMRYKLTFTLGEQPLTEVGEVNQFPPADTWGSL
uniref:ADP-ribosylation factor-binding protein GGA3-like n=2 Tax=Salarias fasciatus TaxID=181472 RepID=A0A672FZL1_SALFA